MDAQQRRRNLAVVVVVALIVVAVAALWVVGSAGFLPWQPEPTRVPITPFADLPAGAGGTPSP